MCNRLCFALSGPISHHRSCVVKNRMYVIGGNRNGEDNESSTIFRLNLDNLTWDTIQGRGTSPSSLDEHTACLTGDAQKIVTFAGFVGGERSNQVHVFTVETGVWEHVTPFDEA